MSAKTEHKEAALAFMKYFTDDTAQKYTAEVGGKIPVTKVEYDASKAPAQLSYVMDIFSNAKSTFGFYNESLASTEAGSTFDDALTKPEFIGLENYKQLLFHDKTMMIALKNSIFFMVFSCVSQLIAGLLLAAFLTNIQKGRNFFKNVYYLPCVLSSAALGLLWMFIFSPKLGINQILATWGMKGPLWLMDVSGFINLPMKVIAFVASLHGQPVIWEKQR